MDGTRSSASSSPDFQFWPVDANPAASPSCADELFSGGVLLPLPVLRRAPAAEHDEAPECVRRRTVAATASSGTGDCSSAITSPVAAAAAAGGGGSKRWTDIFAKKPAAEEKRKDGGSRRAAVPGGGGGGGSELNINIWPFSRSHSAGGGGGSSKPRPPPRKASSAPCSRSNSRSEAAASSAAQPHPPPPRRWAASPGRAGGGVPVGRSSPVWQLKRPAGKHTAADQPTGMRSNHKAKPAAATAGGGKKTTMGGINLSVNSCIGYRHQVSCRRADAAGVRSSGGHAGGGLFGIKGFFSKKVH